MFHQTAHLSLWRSAFIWHWSCPSTYWQLLELFIVQYVWSSPWNSERKSNVIWLVLPCVCLLSIPYINNMQSDTLEQSKHKLCHSHWELHHECINLLPCYAKYRPCNYTSQMLCKCLWNFVGQWNNSFYWLVAGDSTQYYWLLFSLRSNSGHNGEDILHLS